MNALLAILVFTTALCSSLCRHALSRHVYQRRITRVLIRLTLLWMLRAMTFGFCFVRDVIEFVYRNWYKYVNSSHGQSSPLQPSKRNHVVIQPRNSKLELPDDIKREILSDISGFSFECCAWLMYYHIGVARCLVDHFGDPDISDKGIGFSGCSSGGLMAFALSTGTSMLDIEEVAFSMIDQYSHSNPYQVLGTLGRMSKIVRSGLLKIMPQDAHTKVCGRKNYGKLTIAVTSTRDLIPSMRLASGQHLGRNNQELVSVLLASCYIPLYYEVPATFYDYNNAPTSADCSHHDENIGGEDASDAEANDDDNRVLAMSLDGGLVNKCPPVLLSRNHDGSRENPLLAQIDRTVRVSADSWIPPYPLTYSAYNENIFNKNRDDYHNRFWIRPPPPQFMQRAEDTSNRNNGEKVTVPQLRPRTREPNTLQLKYFPMYRDGYEKLVRDGYEDATIWIKNEAKRHGWTPPEASEDTRESKTTILKLSSTLTAASTTDASSTCGSVN